MAPRLIVFDWAGTLVDHGCRAPLMALLQAFEAEDLPIDEATARALMGAHKRAHVRTILALPEVVRRLPATLRALDDEVRVERCIAPSASACRPYCPRMRRRSTACPQRCAPCASAASRSAVAAATRAR
ncbi:MAG: hypothetical protein JNL87_13535 [Burkholderiaceae bacterium]|nr:hypothetical protein [Burkholderiaceae bacterium]